MLIPRRLFFTYGFPSMSWQASSASSASLPQRPELGTTPIPGLARDLAQIVAEPILDIAWFVEAERHQRLDPILRGRPPE